MNAAHGGKESAVRVADGLAGADNRELRVLAMPESVVQTEVALRDVFGLVHEKSKAWVCGTRVLMMFRNPYKVHE
ncbi:hypothetical protein KDX14_27710 [Burkholderia cenocepacia]|uniref:hypothetical protein n=1 Tax=Burkholderia cenocepacia TaxID=95486 RepID=UPI001B9EDFB2|nr:hypothetical protein [Burkholderia cenocepacia]MBR8073317.1 hypothetical protein [Burkholderia cenocepacia]